MRLLRGVALFLEVMLWSPEMIWFRVGTCSPDQTQCVGSVPPTTGKVTRFGQPSVGSPWDRW